MSVQHVAWDVLCVAFPCLIFRAFVGYCVLRVACCMLHEVCLSVARRLGAWAKVHGFMMTEVAERLEPPHVFQVLCMEFLDGIKITNVERIEALGIDRTLLARRTAECYLAQLCRHGFFHCDPHPGARVGLAHFSCLLLAHLSPPQITD